MFDANQIISSVPQLQEKLEYLQQQLNTPDLASALNKSLEIANYVADTISDPKTKLLVEQGGKLQEVTGITGS